MTSLFFVLVQAREQGSDAQKPCPVRILKLFKSSLERAECGLMRLPGSD
jgi:hypothetical protein